jgi:predicted molibdopterin-dependent oxidoreductase YjgC
MLTRLEDDSEGGAPARQAPDRVLRFTFDGRPLAGRPGDSLAAALLANGVVRFRESPVSGAPRGPFCLMGVCFECLVEIDGVANWQACMVPLAEGMAVRTQQGGPQVVAERAPLAGEPS